MPKTKSVTEFGFFFQILDYLYILCEVFGEWDPTLSTKLIYVFHIPYIPSLNVILDNISNVPPFDCNLPCEVRKGIFLL